ncbi:MAG: hypothetical protein HDR29_03400 [Lachnospiraceae bacterium]|nr:hypothetical protein [Lachnospiraceae bacterium]
MDEQCAWIRSRRRKHLRIAAVILCVCLLVTTYPDILAALSAFATEWKDNTVHVSGFVELPEAVRAQTVPLGTGEEELSLPDALEAYAAAAENINPSEGAEQPGNPEGEDADQPGDSGEGNENQPENPEEKDGNQSENTEGEGINPPEDGTGEQGDGSGDTGNPENGNDDAAVESDGGDTQNPDGGNSGSNDDVEQPVGDENADTVEPNDGNNGAETEPQNDSASADDRDGVLSVQSGVFVIPVYMAEPVVTVETQTLERKAETIMIKGVTWQSEPAYDGNVEGTYIFTAVLPDGYALAEGVSLPQITVTVQGNGEVAEDTEVQTLIAQITALPDVQEYMEKEPDIDNWKEDNDAYEEAYEEWMEGLSAYVEEALAIWEAYEALTQEQQAQIPEEALDKLTAWVKIADQVAEDRAVTVAETEYVHFTITVKKDGSAWTDANVMLKSGGSEYPMEHSGSGIYKSGDLEKGPEYDAYVNGSYRVYWNTSTFGSDNGAATLYYVTVTYKNDGADGSVPKEEIVYCGHKAETSAGVRNYAVDKSLPLTKPGYVQTGWSESSGGETVAKIQKFDNGTARETPIILYPVFTPATVTINATNCKPNGITQSENGEYKDTVGESGDYSVTLKADSGYKVPENLTVQIGGKTLASSQYNYSNTTGKLTIPREKITGNITITAEAVLMPATITIYLKLNNEAWSGQAVKLLPSNSSSYITPETPESGKYVFTVDKGPRYNVYVNDKSLGRGFNTTDLSISFYSDTFHYVTVTYENDSAGGTVPEDEIVHCGVKGSSVTRSYTVDKTLPLTKPGYAQTGWSETSGGEAVKTIILNDGKGTVTKEPITLYPVFTPATVTINATNCTHNGATEVASSGDYTVTFTPASGYKVPENLTVQIGGKTLASSQYNYSNTTGKLTIPRENITGNVTITAKALLCSHNLTYKENNKTIMESCDICGHSATVTLALNSNASLTYTGSEIEPVTVNYSTGWAGSKPTIIYTDNTNAGTAKAELTVSGATVTLTFDINSADISSAVVELGAELTYNGMEQTQTITSVTVNGRTLTAETDYTVSGNAGTNAGDYELTITGKDNYTGTTTKSFTIARKPLTVSMVRLDARYHDYTGEEIKPAVTVKDGDYTLESGKDYSVVYANNTEIGTGATVTVTGKGNYAGTVEVKFVIRNGSVTPPDIKEDDLDIGYEGGTIALPDDIKDEVEIYTDPDDPEGSMITPNPDGSLPVEPGDTIYIRYKEKDETTPASDGIKIEIPGRPKAPEPVEKEEITVTDTTITVPKPDDGKDYEYVLVEKGKEPDWNNPDATGQQANDTGKFTDLDPNKEYDLYVREKATEDSFASEPAKTEIRTTVTIKEPVIEGENADKPDNTVTKPDAPDEDGNSVTYTGTCGEDYTPVIIVDGKEITPDITWDEDGKTGEWTYTVPVEDGKPAVEIKVEFKEREYTGLKIEPSELSIYADNAANESMEALTGYIKENCIVTKEYDNQSCDDVTAEAEYTTTDSFKLQGAVYTYYVAADGKTRSKAVTLTVKPVTAQIANPADIMKKTKTSGYTAQEVSGWLPEEVTVTYTGASYAARTENIAVTWNTSSIGANFGASKGSETISGTIALPGWATGQASAVIVIEFSVVEDNPPEISADDLDYSGGIVKLPDDIKDQVEIYTDPDDPEGSRITLNPDGSLPDVEPGTTIYISYPDSEKATEIKIPDRPKAPEPVEKEEVTVTDTTITVSKPDDGKDYEYVLVEKGKEPDWSNPNTTGIFTDLDSNKEYDLYVREKATEDNFASEPAKTEIKTPVTIKEPVIEGENANKPGNNVSKPEAPDADGDSVTYTGTCGEDYTPVIKVDGKDIIPDITWDEDGKTGEWTYTVPVEDGKPAVEIKVKFNKRVYKGLKATPGTLTIYADNAANNSVDALTGYLKEKCVIMAEYDNGVNEVIPAEAVEYTTVTKDFDHKGKEYHYTIKSAGDTIDMTLTVSPVTAAIKAPDALTKSRKAGGYTAQEVSGWLPPAVTVTYLGDGYAAKSQDVAVTWNTDSIGADFGAAKGSKTISGTAALPEWATGEKNVSIEIGFVDNNVLTDAQMNLFISGWTYGAQTVPAPNGSITVSDTDQTYNYLYSADNGTSWVAADKLPKSGSGNIIPGTYIVKMTYTGKNYTGTKTASFTVDTKPLTVEKGTLEVENRKYDGTTKATLKKGGKPELSGVITGDDAMLGGTLSAVFTDKGPKKDIPVSVTGFELTGSDAKCYGLENTTITLKATISKAGGSSSSGGSGNSGGNGDTSGGSGDSGNSGNGTSGNGGNSGNGTGGNTGSGDNSGNTGSNGSATGGNGNNTGDSGNGKGSNNGAGNGTDKGGTKGNTGNGTVNGGSNSSGKNDGSNKEGRNDGTNNGTVNGDLGKKTETQQTEEKNEQSGQGKEAGSTDTTGQNGTAQAGSGVQTEGITVQTVQAAADDGRIVISGDTEAPAATGNLTQDSPAATRLLVGDGTVIVTVVCEDGKYTVGTNDAVSVANAVLTPEQIQLVDNGETMEVRVDIRDISNSVPPQDMETVGKGYEAYGKYLTELSLGAYVDISVYVKRADGGWDAVTETSEPVEIVIGIPEELQSEGREYYIIRAHNGEYNLLEDMDDELTTITVRTAMFSSYAIAYRQTGGAALNHKCGLCHICPTLFGVCCFIWMAVIAAGGFVAVIVILMRKKETEKA